VCNIRDAINVYITKYGKVRGYLKGGLPVPRKGYRTICVTDEVYQSIQKKAKESKRTIPEYIVHLLETDGSSKEEAKK
jgi:hypothetical protein